MPRKVFVAGEILTAADVNTNLMDQAVMVFDDSAARGSAIPTPSEGMVTYLKDTNAVEKFDGSNFVNVDTGKILQVVSTTKTDTFSTTSATFTGVTGLTATITPTSTDSKIFVSVSLNAITNSNRAAEGRIVRNSSPIFVGDASGSRSRSSFFVGGYVSGSGSSLSESISHNVSGNVLDSPATTSSLTYGVEVRRLSLVSTDVTVYVNRTAVNTDNSNHGVYASTITLMEVAG